VSNEAWNTDGSWRSTRSRWKAITHHFLTQTRPKCALLNGLMLVALLMLATLHPALALDAASLQLKWKHQLQFAGYYQALEQGFYRDAGLDVTIREGALI
jgi:NMT1/THI5 like